MIEHNQMVQTGSIMLGITAILSALFRAFVKPRLDELGTEYLFYKLCLLKRVIESFLSHLIPAT